MAKTTVLKDGPGTVADRRTKLHRALDAVMDRKKVGDEEAPRYTEEIRKERERLRGKNPTELRSMAQAGSRLDYGNFKGADKQSLIWHILSQKYSDKTLTAVYDYLQGKKAKDGFRPRTTPAPSKKYESFITTMKRLKEEKEKKAGAKDTDLDKPISAADLPKLTKAELETLATRYEAAAKNYASSSMKASCKEWAAKLRGMAKVKDATEFKKGDRVWANPIGRIGGTVKGTVARINASGQVVINTNGRETEWHPANVHLADTVKAKASDRRTRLHKAVDKAFDASQQYTKTTKVDGGTLKLEYGRIRAIPYNAKFPEKSFDSDREALTYLANCAKAFDANTQWKRGMRIVNKVTGEKGSYMAPNGPTAFVEPDSHKGSGVYWKWDDVEPARKAKDLQPV